MKEQPSNSPRTSTLQVVVSTSLTLTFAIVVVIAASANSGNAQQHHRSDFQLAENADNVPTLGNDPDTPIPTPTPLASPTPSSTPTAPTTIGLPPAACPFVSPTTMMSGSVYYCSNPVPAPIPDVTIQLEAFCSRTTTTNSSGHYAVSVAGCKVSLVTGTVTPSQADRTPGSPGIDTVDIIAAQRHFLIIGPPLSGCRLTAADVNADASVNTIDVLAIQRFVLGLSTGIANVGKYQFDPPNRCYVAQSNQDFDTLIFGDIAMPFIY